MGGADDASTDYEWHTDAQLATLQSSCVAAESSVAELLLHGRPVETMFDLLGRDENDMTFALAWGMASSDHLLDALMARICPAKFDAPNATINLQRADEHGGYTDIEVTVPDAVHVIFEAKRGWNLPRDAQLRLYAERLSSGSAPERLVVLTQWGATS